MNLVSIIMQFVAPAIVGKLASSLGLNQALVQKVLAAALPAILAGLAGKASDTAGARTLSDILGKQDPDLLGKLAGAIGGSQQKQIAEQGGNVLGSLLGANAFNSLTGALGKYAGVGAEPTKGIVGMMAPVVLGTLAKEQKSAGLDASGLANMLAGQKANIEAALPGDFAKLIAGSGLLDSLKTEPAAAKPPAPAKPATPAPAPAAAPAHIPAASARPPAPAAQSFSWLPWIIVIGLAAALWWYLFQGPRAASSIPVPPVVMAGTSDLGADIETSLKSLHGLLAGVTDKASAEAALPRLRQTQAALDRAGSIASGLSPEARRAIAGYVASALPTLVPMIEKLLANTAVGPVVKPVLDALRTRIEAMAKA